MKFLPWSRSSRAVLAAFAAAVLLAACGGKPLYSQLDETQANQVMGALIAAGVDADKNPSPSKTGWEVRVATSDFPYAMQVLGAHGLPRAQFANTCDVFKKEGFASSTTAMLYSSQIATMSSIRTPGSRLRATRITFSRELAGIGLGHGAHPSSGASQHHRSDVTPSRGSPVQVTQPVLFETQVEVHAVHPAVDVVAVGQVPVHERPVLGLPLGREPGDHRR